MDKSSRAELREKNIKFLTKVTDGVMWWIGSIQSLVMHSIVFIAAFALPVLHIVSLDNMLLILTTVLSLEAIYLAIFIQMSVNRSHEHIEDIREDIEEIQDDIEEISEDIEEISVDIDDIQEDIEDIAEDEDSDDHNERARNVMLKSNVSSNKNDIKAMREVIANLQKQLEELEKEGVEFGASAMGKGAKPKPSLVIQIDHDNPKKKMDDLDIPLPLLEKRIYREYTKLDLIKSCIIFA